MADMNPLKRILILDRRGQPLLLSIAFIFVAAAVFLNLSWTQVACVGLLLSFAAVAQKFVWEDAFTAEQAESDRATDTLVAKVNELESRLISLEMESGRLSRNPLA